MNIPDCPKHELTYSDIVVAYTSHIRELVAEDKNLVPYFVTTVFADFTCNSREQLKRKTTYAITHYDRVYRHLTSKLMTNFSKKPHLHPVTVDFVDLPNTKHSLKINLREPSTPHIHSIYLLHQKTLNRFEALRDDDFSSIVNHPCLEQLLSIHAAPIDLSDLERVVSYSAKLLQNDAAIAIADDVPLFNQFPIAPFERELRRSHKHPQDRLLHNSKINLLRRFTTPDLPHHRWNSKLNTLENELLKDPIK